MKTELLGKNLVSLPVLPLKVSQELTMDRHSAGLRCDTAATDRLHHGTAIAPLMTLTFCQIDMEGYVTIGLSVDKLHC
jgi:hypothetical protein